MLGKLVDPIVLRMLRPPRAAARPLPTDLAGRAEDVSIAAPTVPLRAWLVRAAGEGVRGAAGDASGEASGTVVVVHGWGSDAGRMAPLASHLVRGGMTALLVDLPGHGRTGPVERYDAGRMLADLFAVREWVAGRKELAARPTAILGYSFGGLGAYVAASRDPRWAALTVIAAPLGPLEAAELYLDGKGLPGRWLQKLMRRSFIRALGVDPDEFNAASNLPRIRVPVLVVHGDEDDVVPAWHADRIFAAVPSGLGVLMRIPVAGHGEPIADDVIGERIATFFASHMTETRRPA
jgi:pimeloyl-ACP methyl ester carboxylesterase